MSSDKRREEIVKAREAGQRNVNRVEEGTAYHESVKVLFTDRQPRTIEVYALSSKEFRVAAKAAGVDPSMFGKPEKLLDSMDFIAALAQAATRDPDISDKILIDEESKLAIKAMELMRVPKDSTSESPSTPGPSKSSS